MKYKPTTRLPFSLASALSALLASTSVQADQFWDGGSIGPGDNNWNTAANWGLDALPIFTNAINFGGNVRNAAVNNLAADSIIGGINFTNDGTVGNTNAFTLSGARITLGGNITTTVSSSLIADIISHNMILNGNRTITTAANHNLSISGIISQDASNRGLIKDGLGVLTLSGLNTYLGGTTLTNGTLRVGATVGSPSTNGILGGVFNTGITIANSATAVFDINGQTAYIKDLKGGGNLGGNVTLNGGTLYINNSSGGTTYDGIISGAGNVQSAGSSGWRTTGAHTYTGVSTAVSALWITNNLQNGGIASGIGQSSSDASNLIINSGVVSYNNTTAASTNRQFTLAGNGGFAVEGTGAVTWSYTGAMTYSGAGTKTLNFSRNGTGLGTFAADIDDNTIGGSAAISIAKNGTSNWALTNAGSAFTGAITFASGSTGTLSYASAGGANAINFNHIVGTATLSYIGSTDKTMSGAITASALTIGTITFDSSGTGAVNYSANGGTSMGTAGSGIKNLILSGTNTGNNILAGGWNNNTGGAATITKNGASRWTLSGTNNYTGLTTVNAGTLQLAKMVALNNNDDTQWTAAKINVKSAATLAMNVDSAGANGFTAAKLDTLLGNISVANTAAQGLQAGATLGFDTSTANGGTFTQGNLIANSTGSSTFHGAIGVTKLGTGTLIFDKANTYTGATNVNAGTLIVNGSISASSLTTVLANATLGGIGTLGNTVISGVHSPGNSPGIQIFGANLTYEAGSTVMWELVANSTAGRGTNFDGINVGGALDFNGATTLALDFQHTPAGTVEWQDAFWANDYIGTSGWLVYSGATSLTDSGNLTLNSPSSWLDQSGDSLTSVRTNGSFSLFLDGNNIYLNYTIPEPSTALLGGLGLLALLRRRR